MKSKYIVTTAISVWLLIILGLHLSLNYHHWFEPVKTEEIWFKLQGDLDNPFNELRIEYARPVLIIDGYVKYEYWFKDSTAYKNTYSQTLSSFSRSFDKISNQ